MKGKFFLIFCLLWPAVIITGCMTSSLQTQDQELPSENVQDQAFPSENVQDQELPSENVIERVFPSANAIGIYDSNENVLLRPAFINGVNIYLRRYAPVLIEQRNDYVKMTARYDYLLNIELLVKETEYEIIVTVAQNRFIYNRAQRICVKIVNGVNKSFTSQLARGTRVRDRTDSQGLR